MRRPAKLNILITGASSGMGEACARALAPLGHSLVLGARSADKLKKLQKELSKKASGKIVAKTVDVQSTASVKAFTAFGLKSLGSLNVVLACAGLARGLEPIETITDDELEEMVRTNVEGLVKTLRATLPHLKKSGWGYVMAIGSTAGHAVYEGGGTYCATKHGVNALMQTLRLELCGHNIRVTSLDPGMVETNFSVVRFKDKSRAQKVYQGMTPLTGQDIATCVQWLLTLPEHVNIDEMIIKPLDQASHTGAKVHRRK